MRKHIEIKLRVNIILVVIWSASLFVNKLLGYHFEIVGKSNHILVDG